MRNESKGWNWIFHLALFGVVALMPALGRAQVTPQRSGAETQKNEFVIMELNAKGELSCQDCYDLSNGPGTGVKCHEGRECTLLGLRGSCIVTKTDPETGAQKCGCAVSTSQVAVAAETDGF